MGLASIIEEHAKNAPEFTPKTPIKRTKENAI